MAVCYHRKSAWLVADKGLVFRKPSGEARHVTLPCGKCLACRVNSASQWALRAQHEMEYVNNGCFVTLTYNPESCPKDYSLNKKHLQDFVKRLRRHIEYHKLGTIRSYLACGEYGEEKGRPHYHILLLGWSPSDLVYHSISYSGEPIYTSKLIESVWGKGFTPVGTVTLRSAGYVARYAKKAVGENPKKRKPPFLLSSRRIPLTNGEFGALGAQWCYDNLENLRFGVLRHKERPDVYLRIPDYYFDLCERWNETLYNEIKELRYDYAMANNDGLYYFDDNGEIRVGWLDEEIDKYWRQTPQGITNDGKRFYSDLISVSRERMLRLREADKLQTEQLKLLRRNIHERKVKHNKKR